MFSERFSYERDQELCVNLCFFSAQSLNYWKARFLLLPSSPFAQRKVKDEGWGDKKQTSQQEDNVLDGILKFLEVLNRIKRLPAQKVPQTPKVRLTRGTAIKRTSELYFFLKSVSIVR